MFILPMGDLLHGKVVMLEKTFDAFNPKLTQRAPNKVMTLSGRKGYTTGMGEINRSGATVAFVISALLPLIDYSMNSLPISFLATNVNQNLTYN